jgi:hypothetical protein
VVVSAVVNGWCALLDTGREVLEPIRLGGAVGARGRCSRAPARAAVPGAPGGGLTGAAAMHPGGGNRAGMHRVAPPEDSPSA